MRDYLIPFVAILIAATIITVVALLAILLLVIRKYLAGRSATFIPVQRPVFRVDTNEIIPNNPDAYDSMSPTDFELATTWLFNNHPSLCNYFWAEHTGKTGDHGIDAKLYSRQNGAFIGIVQAKRNNPEHSVSPDELRALAYNKLRLNVPYAYLVTTARLSANLADEARFAGIGVIDGPLFKKMRAECPVR